MFKYGMIFFISGPILEIIALIALGSNDTLGFSLVALGIVLFIVGCILSNRGVEQEEKKAAEQERELKQYMDFIPSQSGNTIYLKSRDVKLMDVIKIWNDTNVVVGQKPDKYVYTGVTVGGVHMGNIEKKKGSTYIAGEYENGTCTLRFKGHIISSIQLTDELYEQAKNSSIMNYVNAQKRIVVNSSPIVLSSELSTALHMGTGTLQGAAFSAELAQRGHPSRQKCTEILYWICGIG